MMNMYPAKNLAVTLKQCAKPMFIYTQATRIKQMREKMQWRLTDFAMERKVMKTLLITLPTVARAMYHLPI